MSFFSTQNPGIGGLDELTTAEELLIQSLAALGDPGADRILFWDESANAYAFLTAGSGLTITDTTISATGGGTIDGSGTTNEIAYWVDSDTLGALAVATYPSLTELSRVKGVTSAIQTQIDSKLSSATAASTYQPLDSDLTTIAGLTATTDNFIVSVASAWASRTPAQVRTTLELVIGTNVQAYDADLTTWAGVTPGTGIAAALAIAVGSAGAPVLFNGALGTPSSGTVTNLTGTASININGTVGATTPTTGVFTTLVAGSTTSLLLGTAGSAVGNIGFRNATSGTITLAPVTGALGTVTLSLPAITGTLATLAGTEVFTNKAITKRVVTTTDDATAVIDVAVTDVYELSAIANNTTFSTTGSPTDGQNIIIRWKDAGVSKTLTWDGIFVAIGVTLPTATTAGKWQYVGATYNSGAAKFHVTAVATQA